MHDDVSTCNDAFIAAVAEIIAPKCIKTARMENNARANLTMWHTICNESVNTVLSSVMRVYAIIMNLPEKSENFYLKLTPFEMKKCSFII